MSKFLIDRYKDLIAYVPGEQPQDKKYLKLNTNESPFSPSPLVNKNITEEEINNLNLYSDPTCSQLVNAISKYYNVETENVFTGNGSDEVLAFCFRAFCDEHKGISFSEITYGFYPVFCKMFDIEFNTIPLSNLNINEKDYYNLKTNIIIANPNAQTGLYLRLEQIENIVKNNPYNIVIIDEAYIDFGGTSSINLIKKYNNLIVIKTFSKSRSLAGARIGYAISNKELIDDLNKMKYSFNPYNINRLSIIAGKEAMLDTKYFEDNVNKIIEARKYTYNELKKLGFFVTDSMANFVLVKSPEISGEKLYLLLKEKGILVRHLQEKLLKDYIRVTIGTLSQMKFFIETIKLILKENYENS